MTKHSIDPRDTDGGITAASIEALDAWRTRALDAEPLQGDPR